MGDGGGGHWLVQMEWRPTGWSVYLPLLIFPCTIKSRSSLLAPADPDGPGKRAVKRLWCGVVWCGVVWCARDIAQLCIWSTFDCHQVMTPLMRCVGNIVCGASDDQLEFLSQNRNLYHVFKTLLSSQHPHVRTETLWVLSNITGAYVSSFHDVLQMTINYYAIIVAM